MTGIVIIHSQQLFMVGLASLIGPQPDLEVTGQFQTGQAALPTLTTTNPAVVIIDAALVSPDPILLARRVRTLTPAPAVLVLSESGSSAELQKVLSGGVQGYLRKSVSPQTFLVAIRQLAAGHQVFDPDLVAQAVCRQMAMLAPTARELSTLRLIASGMSNKEVASALRLAPGTVRNYVSAVITKANARNRVDAIRIAREYAWI